MRPKQLPSQEELLATFYYDDKLRWMVDKRCGRLNVKSGDEVVGCFDDRGYLVISFNHQPYKMSRIVYQVVFGNLTPDLVIDHINKDKGDNRIENLRAVSTHVNNRNKSKHRNNITGFNGVYLKLEKKTRTSGQTVEYQHYVAHWYDSEGAQHFKSFSVLKYGKDGAFQLACEYRSKMIQSLNDKGLDYTTNHGV